MSSVERSPEPGLGESISGESRKWFLHIQDIHSNTSEALELWGLTGESGCQTRQGKVRAHAPQHCVAMQPSPCPGQGRSQEELQCPQWWPLGTRQHGQPDTQICLPVLFDFRIVCVVLYIAKSFKAKKTSVCEASTTPESPASSCRQSRCPYPKGPSSPGSWAGGAPGLWVWCLTEKGDHTQ